MPRLHPEHFRRLIRRHGEHVALFRAVPAMPPNAEESSWENRVNALATAPGFKRGWIYETAPLAPKTKVWIYGAGNRMAQAEFGVDSEGESSIVWMPDEIALARPDKIVRTEQSSEPTRERLVFPASHGQGASGPLLRFTVARQEVFALDKLVLLSSAGIAPIPKAQWALVSSAPQLQRGELEIEWRGAIEDLPATGAAIGAEYRFRPALYFLGESLSPRRLSVFGSDAAKLPLPRTGALSQTHPDGE